MFKLQSTLVFDQWLRALRDKRGRARILIRLDAVRMGHLGDSKSVGGGHLGDSKSVGGGIRELRVHHGPGYRVYVAQRGKTLLILLCGGDKSTQVRDIEKAHMLLNTYDEG
ncbi:MAG: type II toxin-antitoxin system RelE/ParE family toxin [Proteobacteria bacterium]|nr:type II toxin-antitoxin system RelE/ParE family toxin [Pseudomonadota bacterium]